MRRGEDERATEDRGSQATVDELRFYKLKRTVDSVSRAYMATVRAASEPLKEEQNMLAGKTYEDPIWVKSHTGKSRVAGFFMGITFAPLAAIAAIPVGVTNATTRKPVESEVIGQLKHDLNMVYQSTNGIAGLVAFIARNYSPSFFKHSSASSKALYEKLCPKNSVSAWSEIQQYQAIEDYLDAVDHRGAHKNNGKKLFGLIQEGVKQSLSKIQPKPDSPRPW